MRCPRDGTKLKKLRISYVCPRCDYKRIQPNLEIYPELNHTVVTPETFAWDSYTLTNCTESGGIISLDSGETSGTIESPQLANLSRSNWQEINRDITKVLFRKLTGAKNSGRIQIRASNDGGTTWKRIKDNNQEWRLNYGSEGDFGGRYQEKYNDLRLRFTLTRNSAGDTSPTVTNFILEYNYIPDYRNTKSRTDINYLIPGR